MSQSLSQYLKVLKCLNVSEYQCLKVSGCQSIRIFGQKNKVLSQCAEQICRILSYFLKLVKGYLSSDNDQALKLESGVKIGVFED